MGSIRQIGAFLLLAVIVALASTPAIAADVQASPKVLKLGPLAGKLDDRLIPAVNAMDDGSASMESLAIGTRSVYEGSVPKAPSSLLALEILVPDVNAQTLGAISATGVEITFSSVQWKTISVRANLAQAATLAQLPCVTRVKMPGRTAQRAQQGLAYNQCDATMHADIARNATGLTGNAQKIGVISDSYNDNPANIGAGTQTAAPVGVYLSGTVPQLSGDIPDQIQVVDFGPGMGTDEGEGMMELIHDIAPKAALAFASGNTSELDFANNVLKLRQAGCTIICDDLFYYEEACFQDGPIAQAINSNYDAGIPHFTAAGNSAANGIFATFTPVNPANSSDNKLDPPDGQDFHDWGLGGAMPGLLPITVPNGADIDVVLQWNQPYQSYGLGAGSSVDLDILLYDTDTDLSATHLVAKSGNAQFVNGVPSGDAFETFQYFNQTGKDKTYYLAVNHYAGSRANTIFRVMFYNNWKTLTYPTSVVKDMTMAGHSAAAKAISCAAVFYADIETNGQWGPDITHINAERFTSKGGIGAAGVPYYFDTKGKPLAGGPVRVDKPDITAPDGGNTYLFGNDINLTIGGILFDDDSFPNFFGTSAAAPNAAAVAALMMERASMTSPAQIKSALQASAHDIVSDIPSSGVGPDEFTGAGWIDAYVAVGLVPSVLTSPADLTVNEGKNATFSVTATGAATLGYQWQKNGVNIPNETSSTLTLTQVSSADDGSQYRCIVSNSYGTAPSASAKLSVNPLPKITLNPQSLTVNQNANATFSVQAVNGPLTYQWRRGTSDIQGATSSSYTLVGATPADSGAQFKCLVTNAVGSVLSDAATLTVKPLPKITLDPQSQTVNEGAPVQFVVTAENGTLTYQWRRGDADIPGATSSTYSIPSAALSDDGAKFYCLVSNGAGSTPSAVAVLTVKPRPKITTPPANITVAVGGTASFSISAVNGPLTYQWRRNSVDIPGALGATYSAPPATLAQSGDKFQCLVSNAAGSALSDAAILTVVAPPQIVSALVAAPPVVAQGKSVAFSVTVQTSSGKALLYTWDFGDGTSAPKVPDSSITHSFAISGKYTVKVTVEDAFGQSASAQIVETVFSDTNDDGVPNIKPNGDNSDFADMVTEATGLDAVEPIVSKLTIKLNFSDKNQDELTLAGTLPLSAGFNPKGKTIQFVVGGYGRELTLGAAGSSETFANNAGNFKVNIGAANVRKAVARYELNVKNSSLKSYFADEGLINKTVSNESHSVRVSILFNGVLFDTYIPLKYTAKKNGTGTAK